MAADLAELLTNISATLGRGTALDDVLLIRIKQAVRQLERNNNFSNMFFFASSISLTTATRRLVFTDILSATDKLPKKVDFFRIVDSTNEFIYLDQVKPQDLSARTTLYSTATEGVPTAFWLDRDVDLVLNAQLASAETAEAGFFEYSNFGTGTGTATSWWFTNGDDLVEAQVMYNISARLRDTEGMKRWQAIRQEIYDTMDIAETSLEFGGGNLQMRYPSDG